LQSIEGVLRTQPGIYSVKVALLAERGVVEYDPTVWTEEKIINVTLAIIPFLSWLTVSLM
jgi:Cu+-exporting ATPase